MKYYISFRLIIRSSRGTKTKKQVWRKKAYFENSKRDDWIRSLFKSGRSLWKFGTRTKRGKATVNKWIAKTGKKKRLINIKTQVKQMNWDFKINRQKEKQAFNFREIWVINSWLSRTCFRPEIKIIRREISLANGYEISIFTKTVSLQNEKNKLLPRTQNDTRYHRFKFQEEKHKQWLRIKASFKEPKLQQK